MNNYLQTLLKTLNEQVNCSQEEEDEELEEASNSTDAYAGGEGPQRTPHAFGGSMDVRKRKFARKSAVYDNPVEETNLWFRKVENHILKTQKIVENQFVSAVDTKQVRKIVKKTLQEYGLDIFSSSSKKQKNSARVGIKFIVYNPSGKYMEGDILQTANDSIARQLEGYSNVSSINLRYGKTSNGFYPFIVVFLRRIGRNESVLREEGNVTTALDGGGLSTGAQISNPRGFATDLSDWEDEEEIANLENIPKDELDFHFEQYLKEGNYNNYRNDNSLTARQKINKTIKEINGKLREVEQMIKHSQKFKNEIGADSSVFYKDTINRFGKISERLKVLQAKIREFNI